MKSCKRCKNMKPLSDFYKHNGMADGHLSFCKDCKKSQVTAHRDINIERIRDYDRRRELDPNRAESKAKYRSRYKKSNKAQISARSKVSHAIRDGLLIKMPCEKCGTIEGVHGHHEDYSKPLDVNWLCVEHHFERHKEINRGNASTVSE